MESVSNPGLEFSLHGSSFTDASPIVQLVLTFGK